MMRARRKGKLGTTSQWKEFVSEIHEFARRYDANDIDHIADKKGVHVEERFSMSGEPHRIWYDSDDKDGEFWMASDVRKKFLQKLDDQIESMEKEADVLAKDPSLREDLIHHRRLLHALRRDRSGYQASIQSHKAAYADKKISREKFIKNVHDSLDDVAKSISKLAIEHGNKDLQLLGARAIALNLNFVACC
jgi:hypothetical protein